MKKLFLVFILIAPLVVAQQVTNKARANAGLATEKQVLALRKAALAKRLTWTVQCLDEKETGKFYGAAWPEGSEGRYIEDGAKPFWIIYGDTQREATLALTAAIAGRPNVFPGHKPKEKTMKCPLPLRGDPDTDKAILTPIPKDGSIAKFSDLNIVSGSFAVAMPSDMIWFDSDGAMLRFEENGKMLFSIAKDGTVKVEDGVNLDDVTVKFWKVLAGAYASTCAGKQ